MLIGMVVVFGGFLVIFGVPFICGYYQIIKQEQHEQQKANASNKSTNSKTST